MFCLRFLSWFDGHAISIALNINKYYYLIVCHIFYNLECISIFIIYLSLRHRALLPNFNCISKYLFFI